ncbi:MAG: TrkA family potassium uptake protein [Actinobacteria bacterium]|nr:TrkA family potassium uptake protein [Actinomycetota bacterium]
MDVIVVGCGRVGSQLAVLLSGNGHNVCVIDKDAQAFRSLGRDFNGRTLKGLGFDEDILIEAGIESCSVVAAVTNFDNSNLMTVEVARKIFDVPHVITRLYSPHRENAYMQLGLDYVCGTTLVAEEIFAKIQSGHGHHIDTFGDYEILRFSLQLQDEDYSTIQVADLEHPHEIRIVAFDHNGETSVPTGESVLYNGDIVVAVVKQNRLAGFSKYMKG